mmetsp:Transcript_27531/g.74478  ORF Transcript_27531/g.74478 Transcript_27531/m.74478 type:complete len:405 (+) Transcript_27531:147-1361(+)
MLGVLASGLCTGVKRQSKAAWALLGCSNARPQSFCSLHASAANNPTGTAAFVFDIDGVLTVLEPAKKAFEKLTTAQGQWKFPVCFLTNGGGVTEAQKAAEISNWLNVPASEDQVILSHTPMRSLVPALQQQPVLICGRGSVLEVARHYGFNRCLTVEQLARALPNAVPFAQQPGNAGMQNGGCPVEKLGLATEEHPIRAVLVMTDPRNWYVDLQIILDVLLSGGVPTRSPAISGSSPSPVDLYFSNPDLLWANDFPRNRLGQGAFAHVLLSMYNELTEGKKPNFLIKWFGKPNPEPYFLAGQSLLKQAAHMGKTPSNIDWMSGSHNHLAAVFSGIYCVGDNPCSDIRGANRAGLPFTSVLVKTGVFKGPGNCPRDPAMICVHDVLSAVEAALHKTRSLRFHSMR